ncbi:MAG TPA: CarD family transcriptional regulator [Polyangiaceae bacterium LLY-WYZ-14_1]|jgi:CarD family transcriptional regulator|nr:CarD family transcriptional regulator [Polyangiaceae bacterium LLY-WYZ-14_1]
MASKSVEKAPSAPPAKSTAGDKLKSVDKFKVGDKAVHPAHGIGEVTSIERREIAGDPQHFYVLRILESGMKVMVPLSGAARLGLRPIITRKEAEQVMAVLGEDGLAVTSQPWNRRYREYTEMLNSGSLVEVAKVLRDLARLKEDKELSFGERRLLDQARGLIIKEISLARRCKESRVEKEIHALLPD